jgi:F-type H+-transporting ATPase subunit gamma
MRTVAGLTNAFQGLASMRITQSKNKVMQSKGFFEDLWQIYSQIRVDAFFRFGRQRFEQPIEKELYILITASGGLSGDIDQRLIRLVQKTFDPAKHEIIVIGRHGASQLSQAGIAYKHFFSLPEKDNINVEPLMKEVKQYKTSRVFYQSYESLMHQEVKSIDLSEVVTSQSRAVKPGEDIISEATYIFEPSAYAVVAHLESSMVRMVLSEVIFESRLAQYASQFRAMSQAKTLADDAAAELHTQFNRSKRAVIDQRLKEMMSGLKKVRSSKA